MAALLRALAVTLVLLGCAGPGPASTGSPAGSSGGSTMGVAGSTAASSNPIPVGRGTLARLNRTEYDNTLRDLLGTSERFGDNLPADDLSFGFDNIADALHVSPLHVEVYLASAERAVESALAAGAPLRDQILSCDVATLGADCARQIIRGFARRALRRPPSEAQLERLLRFMALATEQGDPPLVGLKLALQAALVSPRFLYRVELNPEPLPAEPWRVDDFELASRLAYFLWSSAPDETLLQQAEVGLLADATNLEAQVSRMLADPRAERLVANFGGQWLHLRAIPRHGPDKTKFPELDAELAGSMQRSSEHFLRQLIDQRLPLEQLVTSASIPVDTRLATHYGMPAPVGSELQSMPAPVGRRAGVLGHAGLLMVTSETGRTSPVKRGAWVLGNLLCSPPPPPPPGVEGLDEAPADEGAVTVRQRLERHRQNPACAACHNLMDPIGFGLEAFDAIGRFRGTDNGAPLDTTGVLPEGTSFSNAEELGALLAADPRLRSCVAQKLATYALGRGIDTSNSPELITHLIDSIAASDGSFAALVSALVQSPPFRMRSPEPNGGS